MLADATSPVRLTALDSEQIRRLGQARTPVLIPLGSTEQHGPHLPVGVDTWLATAVAQGAAQRARNLLVAEPLAYGISPHHRAFAGAVTVRPSTYIGLLVDLCASLASDGLIPILLNGHGGNRSAMSIAIAELGGQGVRAAALTYFELIRDEAHDILPDAATGCGHACAFETSLMLHLFPAAVRLASIPASGTPPGWPDPHLYATDPVMLWRGFEEINPTGVIGRPQDASEEAGEKLFAAAMARTCEYVAKIRNAIVG